MGVNKKLIVGIIVAVTLIGITLSGVMEYSMFNASDTLTQGLKVGDHTPDFTLVDPEKGLITQESFQGKPLFVFFTTTWCSPCKIGAENLSTYDDEKGGDTFNVLIVFVDDEETSEKSFITWRDSFGNKDWYVARGMSMAQTFDVTHLDTKYVFDKDGIIRWIDLKPLPYSTIDPVLGYLLEA